MLCQRSMLMTQPREAIFVQGDDERAVAAALSSLESELAQLRPEEFVYINFDIDAAVATVLAKLPLILNLRAEIARFLPFFELHRLDNLERYAVVLRAVHARYLREARPDERGPALLREATELRHTLLADLNALARRGHVDASALSALTSTKGYRSLALDLELLVALFRRDWDVLAGKCAVLNSELERASALVKQLQRIAGRRRGSAARPAETAELRARAFTLFVRAYDETRAAVLYLRRRVGDADAIAPSLFAGRSNGRSGPAKDTPPKT
jgi:hypothetical protein